MAPIQLLPKVFQIPLLPHVLTFIYTFTISCAICHFDQTKVELIYSYLGFETEPIRPLIVLSKHDLKPSRSLIPWLEWYHSSHLT